MARKPEFDRNDVIERAMMVFWRKGYSGTSMRDIGKVTGLNPGSLYGGFGNKRSIFFSVLEHYYRDLTSDINETIKIRGSSVNILTSFFVMSAKNHVHSGVRGCLLVNSLLELVRDSEVQAKIAAMFTGIEEMFYWTIIAGQKTGEFNNSLDARKMSQYLINNYFGIRVQIMTETSDEQIKSVIDGFIQFLTKN